MLVIRHCAPPQDTEDGFHGPAVPLQDFGHCKEDRGGLEHMPPGLGENPHLTFMQP